MKTYPKEFFKIQSDFVEEFYPKLQISRERGYFQLTNFFTRIIGYDYAKFPSERNVEWIELISKIPEKQEETIDFFYNEYLNRVNSPKKEVYNIREFGCFHYYRFDTTGILQLHFEANDPDGNLSKDRIQNRKDELREMFEYIKSNESGDSQFLATTWLFNIEAFTRLFPEEFSQKAYLWNSNNCFQDNSHWGQFLDKDRNFLDEIADQFKENWTSIKEDQTVALLSFNRLFPFPTKESRVDLNVFYKFYELA